MDNRKRTDTYAITATLRQNGAAVNLAGYTVTINVTARKDRTPKVVNGACTILDAPNGRVSYTPVAGDVDTSGTYDVEFKAVAGSNTYHFPSRSYEPLVIEESLG